MSEDSQGVAPWTVMELLPEGKSFVITVFGPESQACSVHALEQQDMPLNTKLLKENMYTERKENLT